MVANQLVQARINGEIKKEAAIVLESVGLTISDAVRLLLTKIANEHVLPFEAFVPNDKTIAAMMEARARKNLPHARTIKELKEALHAND